VRRPPRDRRGSRLPPAAVTVTGARASSSNGWCHAATRKAATSAG
jgi:hypothetical protein